ncbi:hypothetical protein ACHAPX_005975 [Trichoderma viride]
MADNAANAPPTENDESDSTTPPAKITPDLLAQVHNDPSHALNTFLNESDGPSNGFGPRETLEERIRRLQSWVQGLEAQAGSRKEQSHPR